MDYQNLFYLLGSIFMFLGIIMLIGAAIGGYILYQKVMEIHAVVMEKVALLNDIKKHPQLYAQDLGKSLAKGLVYKVTHMFHS